MKLQNSTEFKPWFLRRMISWIAKDLGLPPSKISAARFTKYRGSYRGRAWSSMRFLIRVGDRPQPEWFYRGNKTIATNDKIENLVSVTAHELQHLVMWHDVGHQGTRHEIGTVAQQNRVLELFRTKRDELLSIWSVKPEKSAASAPQKSPVEKRHEKAAADLIRWSKKLKLAQTKVKKLKSKVARYEKLRGASC